MLFGKFGDMFRLPTFLLICFLSLAHYSLVGQKSLGISVDAAFTDLEEGDWLELVLYAESREMPDLLRGQNIAFHLYFENYYRIRVKRDKFDFLLNCSAINYIEPILSKPVQLNDSMISNNRITALHKGKSSFKRAYGGKGVLIGFIDTGIDFSHPDFQDSTGKTRLVKLWDQNADTLISSRIPSWGYGQVWDSVDINAGNCPHDDDIFSHGTNVAGIAAGNGLALNQYCGVAPEADIIYVASNFTSSNWLQTVADAVEFIFNEASTRDMPCVINISAGEYLGSHDGSDLAALRIDSMIKASRGRLVVAAAGNAGNLFWHLGYNVNSDTAFTWFQYNSKTILGYGAVYYQLWADTADFNNVDFAFGANRPSPKYHFRGRTDFDKISNRLNFLITDTLSAGPNRIGLVRTFAQQMGDKYLLEVDIKPDSTSYLFSLITTGNGNLDVWSDGWLGTSHMVKSPLPSAAQLPEIQFYKQPDTLQTIVSSFTCLPDVLTVANYTNRNAYYDVNNVLRTFPVTVGQRAANSSLGPNRRGYQKPDLIASGDYTLAANRLASIPLHIANGQSDRIGLGGMHKRNGGTSMAAPVVAGIAALLLEECSDMSSAFLRQRILQTLYTDAFTASVPNYSYGYGKIDASAALSSLYYTSTISPGGDQLLCETGQLYLNGPSGMRLYSWSNGDSTAQAIVDTSLVVVLNTIDSNACPGIADTVVITLVPNPLKPSINQVGDTLLESSSAYTYQWYKDGNQLSGETSRQLILKSGGTYFVEVIDSNGCSSRSDSVSSYLGVKEVYSEADFYIFPNPSIDGIFTFICAACQTEQIYDLLITNNRGEEVMHRELSVPGTVSLQEKAPGMYFVIIRDGQGKTYKQKVVLP